MRAGLDPWPFVYAAYALAVLGTMVLIGWSLVSMHRAERRHDRIREQ